MSPDLTELRTRYVAALLAADRAPRREREAARRARDEVRDALVRAEIAASCGEKGAA